MAAASASLRAWVALTASTRAAGTLAALYGFLVVVLVASSSGGYLPVTWGWTALITFWASAMVLLLARRLDASRLELAFLGAMFAVTLWTALSAIWSNSVTSTMHEVQRDLAYTGVLAVGVLLVRRNLVSQLLGGVLAGVVGASLYGLGTRLLPDRFGWFDSVSFGYRLSPPITYWNGLGIFAAMGLLLALGFALRATDLAPRTAAAAALPLFTATMYFTFSRGAWLALALALIATAAVDPRRLQLIAGATALAIWPAVTLFEIRRQPGLVRVGASYAEAARDGHRTAAILVVLSVLSACTAVAFAVLERRVVPPAWARTTFAVVILLAVLGCLGAVWVQEGSPAALARRGWDAFHRPPPIQQGSDAGTRLFSLSANGRVELWHVAIRDFKAAPVVGQGAGTFWEDWLRYRPFAQNSREAHSLYLGALGELGAIGLVLIAAFLALPLVGAFCARRHPILVPALGAYTALITHAAVDWDWALVGVTVPGLLAGLALTKIGGSPIPIGRAQRIVVGVLVAVALGAVLPSLAADLKLRAAGASLSTNPRQAIDDARAASRLAPWSSEPYSVIGQAYTVSQRKAAARQAFLDAAHKDPSNWLAWQRLAAVSTGAPRRAALADARKLNPLGRS